MIDKDLVIQKLWNNRIRNINMINFIKEYPVSHVQVEGDSILIKGKSDENWIYISSSSQDELTRLIEKLSWEDQFFAIMEDWMLPILLKNRSMEWKLSCMKLYYPDDIVLPDNQCNIDELQVDQAQYIYDHYEYQKFTTIDYIQERILNGIALGIHQEDKLIAFILTHDDGAIGFLHVLPEYRRKGYAQELTIAAIKKIRECGEIPFVHIEEDNEKSMGLALKAGFKKERRIHWIKIKG